MRINELFDRPYQFTQYAGTSNKLGYAFKSVYTKDGQELSDIIKVEFHRLTGTNTWNLGFHIGGSDKATDNFDSIRIFATVIAIIKEFLNSNFTKDLEILYFGSNIGTGPRAMSRINLYDRLAKKLSSLGFQYQEKELELGQKTYVFKKS